MDNINSHFYYITIATKPHAILEKIKTHIDKQGEKIIVLGTEEERYIGWQSKGNFGIKLKGVYDFLGNPDLNDNDIVCFTDAYDVIHCSNKTEIIQKYTELNKPIVFGAEKICNPDPHRALDYPVRDVEFPYLNSGLFIGRVWALRICMMDYKYNDADDDQRYWTTQFLEHPTLIGLDYKNALFLNTADVTVNEIQWNGEHAIYKNSKPLFIHVNGPNKDDLAYFL
jgi:hypothetical protein